MIRGFQLFWLILERLHLKKFLFVFLLWYVIACTLLWILDPAITTLGDGFWFGFILVTTIGFGDFTVTTLPARIVAGILGLYGDLVITFLTGAITSWFYEKFQGFQGHSVGAFVNQLEHMDQLSDEELREVAAKAKALRQPSGHQDPQ
ncbi:potassium channel family protein [uncultured Faecalibaculum sp.]|uniref:potassium channel family protein n=1 Tax=uncultured Faecalibaculum sp. TaxID=1729681 RepID=UPI0025D791F8|nr:potassium channel family protein [uncultured Faecalibaculum sp.]